MNRYLKTGILTFFLLVYSPWSIVPPSSLAQSPLTLKSCYELALQRSEQVAMGESSIREAEVKYSQALGSVLPHVKYSATEFMQDDSATADGAGAVGTTLTRFSTPTLKFNAKQPLFQGLREFYALSAGKAQKRQNTAEWEDAKRKLFVDVANSFYTVLELDQDLKILNEMETTLKNRLRESKERTKLGKSRISEEMNTESALAMVQATLKEDEGAFAAAKEVLTFFTGTPSDPLSDDYIIPNNISEKDYAQTKIESRPDVLALEEATRVSKAKLKVEKGGLLPTINAEANYYNYRVGFQSNINWDATFTLDFPIFEGGQTRAKIQEARILLNQSELALSEKRRRADLEIKKSFQDFVATKNQTEALELAKTKAQQSYLASEKDFKSGLINNFELLQILRDLEEVKRTYNHAFLQTKIKYIGLKAAAGEPLP